MYYVLLISKLMFHFITYIKTYVLFYFLYYSLVYIHYCFKLIPLTHLLIIIVIRIILLLLISPGIPTWVGQNRSQLVFASWYDDSWLIIQSFIRERGLRPLHFTSLCLSWPSAIYDYSNTDSSFFYGLRQRLIKLLFKRNTFILLSYCILLYI